MASSTLCAYAAAPFVRFRRNLGLTPRGSMVAAVDVVRHIQRINAPPPRIKNSPCPPMAPRSSTVGNSLAWGAIVGECGAGKMPTYVSMRRDVASGAWITFSTRASTAGSVVPPTRGAASVPMHAKVERTANGTVGSGVRNENFPEADKRPEAHVDAPVALPQSAAFERACRSPRGACPTRAVDDEGCGQRRDWDCRPQHGSLLLQPASRRGGGSAMRSRKQAAGNVWGHGIASGRGICAWSTCRCTSCLARAARHGAEVPAQGDVPDRRPGQAGGGNGGIETPPEWNMFCRYAVSMALADNFSPPSPPCVFAERAYGCGDTTPKRRRSCDPSPDAGDVRRTSHDATSATRHHQGAPQCLRRRHRINR